MNRRFAAVIPVIDERDAIHDVVTGLAAAGACCVFVVDGGSQDGTQNVAEAAGALVLDEPRRGYGRACLTGAERAAAIRPHCHDAVVFLDGDGSCIGEEMSQLVEALETCDVALGRRPADRIERGAMPWHARLGNILVAMALSVRTGRRIHDLPPAKALRTEVLERLRLEESGYGWTVQLVARALADPSIRIREVPVAFRQRRGGASKVSGSPRASVKAGLAMIRVAFQATRPRPVIVLIAKAPGVGHAKTRIASDLGAERTADLWTAVLADGGSNLMGAATVGRSESLVMLPRPADVTPVADIVGRAWTPIVQRDAGLPAALAEAFLAAFDRGTDRAIAVAGDVPSIPSTYATDALARLRGRRDHAVLGPSADGGYHLVGLSWRGAPRWLPRPVRRRRRARLARRLRATFDVAMGGDKALEATRAGLASAGWSVEHLAAWSDLDTLTDLRALSAQLDGDAGAAPRTAAWIARHRGLIEDASR